MPSFQYRTPSPASDDKGPALAIVSGLFCAIAFVTTALRLWVRKARCVLGWDDYTIGLAMVLTIVEAGLNIKAVTRGKGKRSAYLSKADIEFVNMYGWYAQHFLFAAMALVKASICLFILRIRESKRLKWFIWIVIGVLFASSVELSIVLLVQCRPISTYWRPSAGVCWAPKVRIYSVYVQAGVSVTTDLICSLLPIAIMWNVQIPLQKKISICGLMAMGLVCTACSAVRVKSLRAKAKDIVYEYCIVVTWAMAELCLGIIATNLATSRAIYHHFFKRDQSTQNSSQRGNFSYETRSRNGYIKSHNAVVSESESRLASRARSEDSEIPLEPIMKKTEIRISRS